MGPVGSRSEGLSFGLSRRSLTNTGEAGTKNRAKRLRGLAWRINYSDKPATTSFRCHSHGLSATEHDAVQVTWATEVF
jgi:hypothetical protein